MNLDPNGALVLFSGGQDSTTCLAWTLDRFSHVETIGFDYGQRHSVELTCRRTVREGIARQFAHWGRRLADDHAIDLGVLGKISDTALTRDVEIKMLENKLPSTFVPGRNILFLTIAACVAYRRGLKHIVGGMCRNGLFWLPRLSRRYDQVFAERTQSRNGVAVRSRHAAYVDRQGANVDSC
jgi:7-cyano-7-deazaguanine synthase